MKRKTTFYAAVVTAFLLCGCTTGNTQNGENTSEPTNTEAPISTEASQDTTQPQGTEQNQTIEQSQMTGDVQTSEQAQNNTVQGGDAQGEMISEEEAKSLALSHAGITTEDITFIKCDLDTDDGRSYYDVEFYTLDEKDFDYEIDPYTGEIIEWDVEPIYDVNS